MAEAKTVEQLQAELDAAMGKVNELTGQVRGLAAERDSYRSAAHAGEGMGTGTSPHVLGKTLGVDADYSAVDAYYVTREQHKAELQHAVDRAYALAKGDMMVMREIDRALTAYTDLANWDSPLSKKTLDILQKEGYGGPRRDAAGTVLPAQRWEDLVYSDVHSLPRAARIAHAELIVEKEAAAAAAAADASAQGAAGMASGGAPAGTSGATISEEAWMKAAEAGDTASMRDLLKQHAAAVTGSPA